MTVPSAMRDDRRPLGSARQTLIVIAAALAALGAASDSRGTKNTLFTGWVAYERIWLDEREGNSYQWIALARADGRAQRNITARPRRGEQRVDHGPAWSTSSQLAFVRSLPRWSELLVAEPGGWRIRMLTRDTDADGDFYGRSTPAWSPDEQHIAWPASSLFVVAVEGGARRRVAGESCVPRWSPDAEMLLFLSGHCSRSPQHRTVEVVRLDGTARRVVARGSFNSADWSPDGRHIAYAGRCERGPGDDPWCRVLVSNADGSRLRTLPLPEAWVADWVRWVDDSTIVAGGSGRISGRFIGLVAIDLPQRTFRALAPNVGVWPQRPAVGPDGRIAVMPLFPPRGGPRPALVDPSSGSVNWGRTPAGWSRDVAAICPACP